MAIVGFLNTAAETPIEAVIHALTTNPELVYEADSLKAEHVKTSALPESDEHDGAWAWRLTDDAPGVQDTGVTTVYASGGSSHPWVDSGIVVSFDDYGGYVVIVDTDNEDADALIEYAASQLEPPARP